MSEERRQRNHASEMTQEEFIEALRDAQANGGQTSIPGVPRIELPEGTALVSFDPPKCP